MQTTTRTLLTVVAEAAIERPLLAELERLGAGGYTMVEARGSGEHGRRDADWEQNRNLRIEVLCDEATARRAAERLFERFGREYAMVLWLSPVEVLRGEKFERS